MTPESQSGLSAYALRCEYRTSPLGIDVPRPRLSWRVQSSTRGDRPTSSRVTVAAESIDPTLNHQIPVWDSGWMDIQDTSILYGGSPLNSSTRYIWSVQMRDREGRLTQSSSSWFETGLLHIDEWTAQWIGWEPEATPPVDPPSDWDLASSGLLAHLNRRLPPCTYVRRTFVVDAPFLRARLYVSARGLYQAFINGKRIGDGELTPGWTDYRFRVQYQVYDVTADIAQGDNVVAAALGDGWYCGRVGPSGRRLGEHYGSRHELIAQLRIDHVNGAVTTIVSDNEWMANRSGPLRFSDPLAGEYFDATLSLGAWSQPNYDDSRWTPVAVSDSGSATLVATVDEPVRTTEFLRPVRITRAAPGRFIVDLGQNMVGRCPPYDSRSQRRRSRRLTARRDARSRWISVHREPSHGGGNRHLRLRRTADRDI